MENWITLSACYVGVLGRYGICNEHDGLCEWYEHEGEMGIDESSQALTWKN